MTPAGPEEAAEHPIDVTETLVAAGSGIVSDSFPTAPTALSEWNRDRAVTNLYSEHYHALVELAKLLVGDTPTAEEVVQDSFVALHGGLRRQRDADKALAYLRQAVVNRSRSVLRHRSVVDKNLQSAPPDMPSAENSVLFLLERSLVVAALRRLPDRQREVVVLRYYVGLSVAEIAEAMGMSHGTVRSLIAHGIAALRSVLEKDISAGREFEPR